MAGALLCLVCLVCLLRASHGVSGALAAHPAPPPTATATTVPTQTPYPTYTSVPTATTQPTATTPPTGPISGTAPLTGTGTGGGPGFSLGFLGTIHWFDFLGSLGSGLVGWLLTGVTDLIKVFSGLLADLVRVDRWAGVSGFFAFMLLVGGGLASGLAVVGAVLYYRSMMPGGQPRDGAMGLGMITRTLETAVLLGGLGWGLGQLFDLAQALVNATAGYTGALALQAFVDLTSAFTGAINPISIVLGIVGAVVYALIVLTKYASVAALCWLVVIAPLVMATWTLGPGIAARWFRSLASLLLWGVGWGVWFLVSTTVLADYSVNPLLKPFLCLALLLFGYGVPRMVDHLIGSAMAGLSAASAIGSGAVGVAAGAATSLGLGQAGRLIEKPVNRILGSFK